MSWMRDLISLFDRDARAEKKARHALRMKAIDRAGVRMQRAWEAADTDRFRGEKWLTSNLSIASEQELDLLELWDRAADLTRNDPYAASAVNGRVDNVIGSGMSFHSRVRPYGDLISEDDARKINDRREIVFREWSRKDRFRSKQREFEKSKAIFGEGLGVISDIGTSDGRPIPLTWQIINPRRLETPPEMEGDPLIRMGIRFSDESYTVPVTYYIRDVEKNDTWQHSDEYTAYPAWRVTHSFESVEPGALRGTPWMAPVMGLMKDRKDYAEAKLIAEQVAACTTTFIKTEDPYARAVAAATGSTTDEAGGVSRGARLEEISPGLVHYIGTDEDVTHIDPNRPGNTYAPYIEHNLMGIAAGLRYPYALLAKDFRKSSFANGRLEMSDGRQTFEVWQQANIDDAFMRVCERATEEMVILGLIPEIDASAYQAFPMAYNACQLKPTRFRMAVNPKQETDADAAEVEQMFASRSDKCDEREADFDDVLAAQEREQVAILEMESRLQAKRQELGLVPIQSESDDGEDPDAEDVSRQLEEAGVTNG